MFLEGVNSLQKIPGRGTGLTFHRVFLWGKDDIHRVFRVRRERKGLDSTGCFLLLSAKMDNSPLKKGFCDRKT